MATLDAQLSTAVEREFLLRRALSSLSTDGVGAAPYEWVVLDTGPYMGILSINALTAADAVVLPLPPEYVVLLGGKMLLEYVERVRDRLNPGLRILGILPTMVDSRTRHAKEMLEQLRTVFGELLFEEPIPYTVRLKEAPILGTSILSYEPSSKAAFAYRRLAEEVRARCLASV
jgi:chromosome partitioning protein